MFHQEKMKNRTLSPRHQIPRSLGVMKKKGCYHFILENYITTDYSGLMSSGLGVQWPYGQLEGAAWSSAAASEHGRGPEAARALALFQQAATSGRGLSMDPAVLASSPPGSEMLATGHGTNFFEPGTEPQTGPLFW